MVDVDLEKGRCGAAVEGVMGDEEIARSSRGLGLRMVRVILASGRFGYAESKLAASRRPSNERLYAEVRLYK